MATVKRSQLDQAKLRRSADDLDRILHALDADGSITVEDDEPVEPEPQLDEEGNEVTDEEGNVVYLPPAPVTSGNDPLEIQVDADDEAAEEAAAAAEEDAS